MSSPRRPYRIACGIAATAALAVSLIAAWSAPANARPHAPEPPKSYALIFGTVWDPDGHPLFGVKVKIRRADEKKAKWELYSNHTGEFAQRVPVGPADYIVWADIKDLKLENGKHLGPGEAVKVHIDGDERSDMSLHLVWK